MLQGTKKNKHTKHVFPRHIVRMCLESAVRCPEVGAFFAKRRGGNDELCAPSPPLAWVTVREHTRAGQAPAPCNLFGRMSFSATHENYAVLNQNFSACAQDSGALKRNTLLRCRLELRLSSHGEARLKIR